MSIENEYEVSALNEVKTLFKKWISFYFSKWKILLLASVLGAGAGLVYCISTKPIFIADLTFALENDGSSSSISPYSSIASQFGIDFSSSNGAFSQENMPQLLKSQLLIQKTLLTQIIDRGESIFLINYLIKNGIWDKKWHSDTLLFKLSNQKDWGLGSNRASDSVLKKISQTFAEENLSVQKSERNSDIIKVAFTSKDEVFAKYFVEQLTKRTIDYYVNYKSSKSSQNVSILEKQLDSVKNILNENMVGIASSNDLNVNPLKQIVKVSSQKKQLDIQVNTIVYGEILKNLELAKINLRKEIPFMQIIDAPILPLEKKQLSKKLGVIIFSLGAFLITMIALFIKKIFN